MTESSSMERAISRARWLLVRCRASKLLTAAKVAIEKSTGGVSILSQVTQILSQIESGDPSAAEQLLPLIYAELRSVAAAKLAHEKPGQTLQATALVHEAYLRLVDVDQVQHWDSRRHFFAAAAEAMRRILVDRARRKGRVKRGGDFHRVPLDQVVIETKTPQLDLLALDEALDALAAESPEKAEVVQLRYFAGLGQKEIAELLGVSTITVKRHWRYARAWLLRRIEGSPSSAETQAGEENLEKA